MPAAVGDCCMPDEESQKLGFARAALSQLLEVVDSKLNTRVTILEESHELMLRIGLMADCSEFSRFYNFVFFIFRENGQKNITVSRAFMAWRLVLAGRFRLLDQWCNFIELEKYLSFRIRGSVEILKVSWDCGGLEPQPSEDFLTALNNQLSSKRKSRDNLQMEIDFSEGHASASMYTANPRRRHIFFDKSVMLGRNQLLKARYAFNEMGKDKKNSVACTKSLSAIEGSLSKGFARLLSGHSARLNVIFHLVAQKLALKTG